MSIETLLEAAKFLELQAQQQQKAREEELKEKLQLEQLSVQRKSDVNYNSTVHINNVPKTEEPRTECRLFPIPPSLPPASMPIAVIPIPVVTPNPTGSPTLPVATLSHLAAPPLVSPKRDPHSPKEESSPTVQSPLLPKPEHTTPLPINSPKQPTQNHHHHHHPQLIAPNNNIKHHQTQQQQQQLVQRFPGPMVSPPQQHALLPQLGSVLQQAPVQNGRGSPPEDSRQLDKKRPGGAGTREVHNKLEQHRRAHLKECFQTLKKNVPNIDEKKTSNLSVLRSALRYIQTLKRKEKEYEHDMERLAREKIATQQRLAELKNDLSQWMDVMEIERVLRQTVQPEEDQASTSTASEGEEEVMEDDLEQDTAPRAQTALPTVPPTMKPEPHKSSAPTQTPTPAPITTPTPITTATSFITQHISIQHKPHLQPQPLLLNPPQAVVKPAAAPTTTSSAATPPSHSLVPAHTQVMTTPSIHPTVIAHASVSHPSVIQAVNHVIQGGPKHIAHLAPSTTSPVQLAPAHQPIGHITVHPVAHLSQHLPALYPQPVAVTQSAVVGHITHTLNHAHPQVNGTSASQPAATIIGKQAVSTQMMAHHPQLVGQTVLNPVTMVTMPSFPISTLKLA